MPQRLPGSAARPGSGWSSTRGNEKITYKVREHSLAKVPIMLVVGRREAANRSVAMRRLGGKEQEALALGEAVARFEAGSDGAVMVLTVAPSLRTHPHQSSREIVHTQTTNEFHSHP